MKRFAMAATLFTLSACADFPPGTKVAPAFPNDQFELSRTTKVPGSQEPAIADRLGR
jgi:predicted small lipoprotein YifL